MTENKVPWRRLWTEAVVIVGSILLAFAIDAAWDRYQDERRLEEYIVALEGEFEEARLEMTAQLEDRAYQLAAVDSLVRTIRTGERSDRLWAWVDQLRFIYVFGPSQPAFESLSSSNGLDLLISSQLRFSLLRYGQAKEFLEVLSARELRLWEDLTEPYLLEHTDAVLYSGASMQSPPTSRFDSGAERLYSDRFFHNLLVRRRGRISGLLEMDRDVLANIDAVLEAIALPERGSM